MNTVETTVELHTNDGSVFWFMDGQHRTVGFRGTHLPLSENGSLQATGKVHYGESPVSVSFDAVRGSMWASGGLVTPGFAAIGDMEAGLEITDPSPFGYWIVIDRDLSDEIRTGRSAERASLPTVVGVSAATEMEPQSGIQAASSSATRASDVDAVLDELIRDTAAEVDASTATLDPWALLHNYLVCTKDEGLVAMAERIAADRVPAVVASTLLRSVGIDPTPASVTAALWLLRRGLLSKDAAVRDSAVAGLMNLDHPSGAQSIRDAVVRERDTGLRRDMVEALRQWE